jgi:hypothetical protein
MPPVSLTMQALKSMGATALPEGATLSGVEPLASGVVADALLDGLVPLLHAAMMSARTAMTATIQLGCFRIVSSKS